MASEGSGDDHGEGDTRGERLIPQLRARRTTGAALVGALRGDALPLVITLLCGFVRVRSRVLSRVLAWDVGV